jgi:stage II sporulation protein D
VRVLLREGGAPLRVAPSGGRARTLAPVSGGLALDGRSVGSHWRLSGGVHAVDGLRVRGEVLVARVAEGLRVVNRLPLEHYVAATVGREVYADWDAETLKAQAVVARTYVLHEAARRRREPYDVEAGTHGQVYGGLDAETPSVVAATHATRGEYLAWRGEPILAVFHSASGGRTASAEEVWGSARPYLVSVDVENEEDSPDTYWRATLPRTTLGRALAPLGVQVGPVQELRVSERSESGRARSVSVQGRDGEAQIEARALRRALGEDVIRSTLFETRSAEDAIVIVGSGHGHGVGMSQWGAQAMALRGASYRHILATFYPGAVLVDGPSR